MKLFFIPIFLSIFTLSNSQLINMKVCSDLACNTGCVSWTASNGVCSPCQGDPSTCSITNPSSIVTTSSISLYSDDKCSREHIITGTYQMPLTLDQSCHILYTTNTNLPILSYRALNLSALIGITIGAIIILIILIICILKFCCKIQICYCSKQPPPSQNAIIITDERIGQVHEYGYPIKQYYPQQYPQQQYPQQQYPQQQYPQQQYPQQQYPQQYPQQYNLSYPQPSAPPYPQPSAPPLPSAPPANYSQNIL